MDIIVKPIAVVRNSRSGLEDDFWGDVVSEIILTDEMPDESLEGIDGFSHLEIIFYFNQAPGTVKYLRHPRGNKLWPLAGIFAQRAKDRPNKLGTTTVELVRKENRKLIVKRLDAIDGTPVLDIKPVLKEFTVPQNTITQPGWATELMLEYWNSLITQ